MFVFLEAKTEPCETCGVLFGDSQLDQDLNCKGCAKPGAVGPWQVIAYGVPRRTLVKMRIIRR